MSIKKGRCTSCNDIIINYNAKTKKEKLEFYREHVIEISGKHLMRVAVCIKCKEDLISGDNVKETANKILQNHKAYWHALESGKPKGFEKFKVSDPNSSLSKHLRNKMLKRHTDNLIKQEKIKVEETPVESKVKR